VGKMYITSRAPPIFTLIPNAQVRGDIFDHFKNACAEMRAKHKINDIPFLYVKTGSPKKYHVKGMKIAYPMPNARNLIDQSDMPESYIVFVAMAKRTETIGPKVNENNM